MSDNNSKKRQARYNPGELDKTRKNLGDLSDAEARKMAAILGGEVGYEKKPKPAAQNDVQKIVKTATSSASTREPEKGTTTTAAKPDNAALLENSAYRWILPTLTKKQRKLFRKLCSSGQYKIQSPFFIFDYLFPRQKKDPDAVTEEFILNTLEGYINRMQLFRTHALKLLSAAQPEAQKKY